MTEKNENILFNIFMFIFAIYATIKILIILFLLCICIPIVGWWFFGYIFAPYFGYYNSYWEFIILPLIAIFIFLQFFIGARHFDD